MTVPEKYRLINHKQLGSDSSYGNNGFFIIPHYKIIDYFFQAQVSDGEGWEHVSISLIKEEYILTGNGRRIGQKRKLSVDRCPTWEEMCWIKDLFWDEDETVTQFHPPKSKYVNMHKYCLHLWKPVNFEIPVPDSILVGLKSKV